MKIVNSKTTILLKLFIAIAVHIYIVYKIKNPDILDLFVTQSSLFLHNSWCVLMVVFLLMPVAWGIEAFKWKSALKETMPVTIGFSVKSVLYGIAAGLITPNRTGDPFGRIAFMDSEYSGKAFFLAVWCGFCQQAITLIFGGMGLAYLLTTNTRFGNLQILNIVFVFLFVLTSIVVTFFLSNIKIFSKYYSRLNSVFKFKQKINFDVNPSFQKTLELLFLSFLRYIVFSAQLVVLMRLSGIDLPLEHLYATIFTTYLFASIVPTFALSEAGVRAGFAVAIIGSYSENHTGIVFATILLWVINVALPGLIGVWLSWISSNKSK